MSEAFKHSLLQRQIRKYLIAQEIDTTYIPLLHAIEEAYHDADEERWMLERSLELTSEEMLQRNQELSGILNSLPTPCLRLNPQGLVIDSFGKHKTNSIWKNIKPRIIFHEIFPETEAHLLNSVFSDVKSTKTTREIDFFVVFKGMPQYYSLRILPLNIHVFLLFIIDTTEQRQRALEIEEQNRQLRSFHQVSELIMRSSSLEEAYQQTVNQLHQLTSFEFIAIQRCLKHDNRAEFLAASNLNLVGEKFPLDQTLSHLVILSGKAIFDQENINTQELLHHTEKKYKTVVCIPMKTDQYIISTLNLFSSKDLPLSESFQQWMLSLGNYLGVLLQRKEESVELKISKQNAEVASEAKNRFLATMSHEFRTPLNAILGFSRVLLKSSSQRKAEQQLAFISRIYQNGLHLLALVNDILDISSIEAGKQKIELKEIDLSTLLMQVIQEFEEPLLSKELKCQIHIDNNLNLFRTDPKRLRQILLNLISNAIKFTPKQGEITIRVHSYGKAAQGIEVKDNGIGISTENRGKIFESFYQVDSSNQRIYEGSGLGLSICNSLCQLLHYTIEVESQLGKGTSFTIDFKSK